MVYKGFFLPKVVHMALRAFKKAYGRTPTLYASQGYDAARLIGSALKSVNGDVPNLGALRQAVLKADFETVRGKLSFSANQHPIRISRRY